MASGAAAPRAPAPAAGCGSGAGRRRGEREGAAAGFIKRGEGCLEEGARRGGGVRGGHGGGVRRTRGGDARGGLAARLGLGPVGRGVIFFKHSAEKNS